MNKIADRIFCGLMAFAAAGHLFGTFTLIEIGTELFVWSLSGVLAAILLTAINALRTIRTGDRAIAWIALMGNIGWLVIVSLFGRSIGNLFDPRVLTHAVAALGLLYFSVGSVRAK